MPTESEVIYLGFIKPDHQDNSDSYKCFCSFLFFMDFSPRYLFVLYFLFIDCIICFFSHHQNYRIGIYIYIYIYMYVCMYVCINTKVYVYMACVVTVLLYAAETWTTHQ